MSTRARARETTPTTGTRIPDNYQPTPELIAWAREHAPTTGHADHEAFCDYWRSVPGARGRKLDWAATWRNWMRREHERRATRASPVLATRRPSTTDQRVTAALELAAQYEAEEARQ